MTDRLIEALNCLEALVGERLVDKLPEMFGRLQFGAVSGLQDKADTVGHGHHFHACW
jgi:predicted HAD superfamily phosphohydrolase